MTNPDGGAVPAPLSTPRPTVGHCALLGLLFLAAFGASCVLLGRCLPFPAVALVREKVEYLARHGDEYDVLFLGSSRIHSQVMPVVFDRVAAENGVPVKSFNAGVAGMNSPEDGYLLEEILRLPHRRLRWVFIELSRLGTGMDRAETSRFGYWHDTARLMLIARRLHDEARERLARNPAAPFSARCEIWSATAGLLYAHARQWVMRAINLGRGTDWLGDWLRAPGQGYVPGKTLGARHDGWLSGDRGRKPMSGGTREIYERTLADRLAQPAAIDRGDPVSQAALERLLAAVTQSGATPVLIVPPTTAEKNFFPTVERERELTILDFSDVRQHADLFSIEHRMDVGHVNTAGAELFSQALAERFVELAKKRGQN